ncbi:MAG: histidine kinase [Opitutae bacterium]|nr:histidine kinase [Opitutae bacterium]MDG1302354.1 histidine kinase [Opitutae bacterium]
MHLTKISQTILLAGVLSALPAIAELDDMSLSQLEQHLAEIDAELEQLASFTVRGGTGSLGYRSNTHTEPDTAESIRIELDEAVAVDAVVLVPVLNRDAATGLQSNGFPIAFRILAGTANTSQVVASFSADDHLLPRIAPLVVPFAPVKASWVAIEATSLSSTFSPTPGNMLQLSEIMVFSGMENVALPLQKPIGTAPPPITTTNAAEKRFLTDGFTPFLMNPAQGSSSKSRVIRVKNAPASRLTLTIDLKTSQPVHQINLHTADITLNVPMSQFSCWGVPRHIRIIGANRPDFADATFLCEYNQQSIYDNGPIIMRRFPETQCRYIRLEILDPLAVVQLFEKAPRIAFSEIEVLSKNQNIARGALVTPSSHFRFNKNENAMGRITDGLNFYGSILPTREWMEQLARRHDLEADRPLVVAKLARHYDRQKTNLNRMIWLSALLAAGIFITILIDRLLRMRHVTRIRERFAADLHDELGADLHTIGLLSDLASEATNKPEKLNRLLQQIRTASEETGAAVRYCSNMQEAGHLYAELPVELRRLAERILVNEEHHQFTIEGAELLKGLKPSTRSDLFLFYKECLINVCKHSGATQLSTQLIATQKETRLTVTDNGCGLTNSSSNNPRSLKRRARLMGARIHTETPPSGGTSISLRLRR